MAKQPLVLIDIDETILDQTYSTTCAGLPTRIRELTKAGWLVGLNSDTPIQRVNLYANEWGCNGPLVVEYGAAVYDQPFNPSLAVPHYNWPAGDPWRSHFDAITKEFLSYLRIFHSDICIFLGDPMVALDCIRRMREVHKPWIIVNGFRRHSLSFVVRRLADEGTSLETDETLLRHLSEHAKLIYADTVKISGTNSEPLIDVNPAYGVCIIHRPEASKRRATPYLTENYDPIIMIGNSMSDHLDDGRVIQCAVSNASDAYQKLCRYTSSVSFTLGVMDCLDWVRMRFPLHSR